MDSIARLIHDLELDRVAGLFLNDLGSAPNVTAGTNIGHFQAKQIATAKLAIQRQIEEGRVAFLIGDLEPDPDRPDLPGFESGFCPTSLPLFQGRCGVAYCRMTAIADLLFDGNPQ